MKILVNIFISLLFIFPLSLHAEEISPDTIEGATKVSAEEAKKLFDDGVLFVDARSDKDWAAGRVPDALHLDVKRDFTEAALLEEITKNDPVVMYCNGLKCLRSTEATKKAVSWGFSKVYYFRTGFPSWKEAGYGVE